MYRMKGFQSSIPSVWTFLVLADADYDKVRIPPVLDDLFLNQVNIDCRI